VDQDCDYGGDAGEYEDDEETLEEEEAVDDGDDAEELNDLAKVSTNKTSCILFANMTFFHVSLQCIDTQHHH